MTKMTEKEIAEANEQRQVHDENAAARDGVEDRAENDLAPRGDQEPPSPGEDGLERRETIRMSPGDAARAEMAKKFRRADSVPFNGDPNDPEMLYGDVARETLVPEDNEPENISGEDREPAPQAQQPPQKRKIKVRGQEIELTDDEILERAAKVTAADSYLEEARELLRDAKTIKAERAGRDRQHPDEQSSTPDDEQELEPPQDQRRPVDTKSVVEKIQFGDPEEAAQDLDELIERKAGERADNAQLKRVMDNDLAKSQKALKDFVAANPELDADRLSATAIENILYDIYREEILSLGQVDADKIPKNPQELAYWHRFYRVNGHQVSDFAKAINTAKERFEAWRGKPATPQQPRKAPTGRVEVNVDRSQRRAAIPNQPERAVAPRPAATQQQAPKSRSDVIAQMKKARGQITA